MKFSLTKHLSNYCRRVDSLKIFDTYGEKAGIAFYTIAHVAAILVICTVSLALVDTERNNASAMTQLNISTRLQSTLNRWNEAKLGDAFANYKFGFRPVMPFKRTRVSQFQSRAKSYNRAGLSIPSVVNSLDKLPAYFPTELRKTVRAVANPKYQQARTICMNLQWEDSKKVYREVMLQDLCHNSRVNRGLSVVPWKYEVIDQKDQASCEANNGHWSRKNVCRVLRVAKEVCGLVFPGATEVAYLGGCFNNGEAVRYETLGFNETFSLTQLKAKLLHPADPIVEVKRGAEQENVAPMKGTSRVGEQSAAGFSMLTLALMCVAAVLVTGVLSTGAYVKYRQRFVALKLEETPVPTAELEMSDETPASLPVPSESRA